MRTIPLIENLSVMNITVNGNAQDVDNATSVTALLADMNLEIKKGLAVAVNDEVLTKDQWNKYTLKDDDKVLIIKASQGG